MSPVDKKLTESVHNSITSVRLNMFKPKQFMRQASAVFSAITMLVTSSVAFSQEAEETETSTDEIEGALTRAKELSAAGTPVLINLHLAPSDFRKGSLSM